MHLPIELHRHRGRIPDNGQFLTTSYTSLYFILDKYHYSKAPSPGVNDCFVSCMVFGIDLPVKSFWYRYNLKREILGIKELY